MVLFEDHECGVCYQRYTRSERVPRKLYCNHTFCDLCLETMSQQKGSMLTVRCPLCRQVSCVRHGVSLQEALWIDSRVWDCIPAHQELEEDRVEVVVEEDRTTGAQATPAAQANCGSRPNCMNSRPKLRLRSILARLFPRPTQERIVPVCNVQMKAWRRVASQETL